MLHIRHLRGYRGQRVYNWRVWSAGGGINPRYYGMTALLAALVVELARTADLGARGARMERGQRVG